MRKTGFIILGAVILFGCVDGETQKEFKERNELNYSQTVEKELFMIGENEKGLLLFDSDSEYEKVILVTFEQAEQWKLERLETGDKVNGTFDHEGWELLDVKKFSKKMI